MPAKNVKYARRKQAVAAAASASKIHYPHCGGDLSHSYKDPLSPAANEQSPRPALYCEDEALPEEAEASGSGLSYSLMSANGSCEQNVANRGISTLETRDK